MMHGVSVTEAGVWVAGFVSVVALEVYWWGLRW